MITPPPVRRSRLRTLFRSAVIVLVLLAAGLFFARRQIGNALARELDARLSAAGVFIEWQSADWVPGPGIRLHGLAVYRDAEKSDRIGLIGNVTAIKGNREWNQWDTVSVHMKEAMLTLGRGDEETTLEDVDMSLLIQPGRADLQECRASLQGLRIEVRGDYLQAQGARGNAEPAGPNKGLFDKVTLDWLKSVKAWVKIQPEKDAPLLKVEFHSQPDGTGLDLTATLVGSRFRWRGQRWDFIQASVKTAVGDTPSPMKIEHLRLGYGGQTGEMTGVYDPVRGVLRVTKLDSGIDVLALTRALAPSAAGSLAAVTTTGDWRMSGAGDIPLRQQGNVSWDGEVALSGEFIYASGRTRVALQRPTFALGVKDRVVTLSGLKAGLWDGNLDAPMTQIHLSSATAKPRFDSKLTVANASLHSVRSSFGTPPKESGIVQVTWNGGGGFELASVTGSGAVSIREAEFFRIPLLGPLHLIFDQLAPGFGRDVASALTSQYRLGDGLLQINNLKLDSTFTRIEANGSIDLARQYARLTAKAKMQGIVGLATGLLSALIELEGEGPVSDVRWKLKNIPGIGVLGDAAGLVGKTGGAVIGGAGSAVKKTTGVGADAVKGTGKAVKGLLKLPGKLIPGN